MLIRDIGAIMKTHVPTLASTFDKLDIRHQNRMSHYLQNMYVIPPDDKAVRDYIAAQASDRYKDWKHRCHNHYKIYGVLVPLEFRHRRDQWEYLLRNEFMNEEKKVICERNQKNRTKNPKPMKHHSGPKPFRHMAEELLEKGDMLPLVIAALKAYQPCKNIEDKVKKLQESLLAKEQAQEEQKGECVQAEPVPVEEQCNMLIQAFGERRGTEVRGVGGTLRRPAKKRGPVGGGPANKRQELEVRATQAEERAKKAVEEATLANGKAERATKEAQQATATCVELQKQLKAFEALLQQLSQSQQTPKAPEVVDTVTPNI